MKYHLPERIVRELCFFAQKYSITRIVLFGSRARGTNAERSDIDIAVYGGDFDNFYWDVADSGFSIKCEMPPSVLYFMCGKLSHLPAQESYDKKRRRAEPSPQTAICLIYSPCIIPPLLL